MATALAEIRVSGGRLDLPCADCADRFDQQLLQTAPDGVQQGAVVRLISGFPLLSS